MSVNQCLFFNINVSTSFILREAGIVQQYFSLHGHRLGLYVSHIGLRRFLSLTCVSFYERPNMSRLPPGLALR
jgi:hypothetical protein